MVVDGNHFPAGADGRTIHRVNPVGAAVRCLSVAPTTSEEILSMSHGALSMVFAIRIERDLCTLQTEPQAKALIQVDTPAGGGSDGD